MDEAEQGAGQSTEFVVRALCGLSPCLLDHGQLWKASRKEGGWLNLQCPEEKSSFSWDLFMTVGASVGFVCLPLLLPSLN